VLSAECIFYFVACGFRIGEYGLWVCNTIVGGNKFGFEVLDGSLRGIVIGHLSTRLSIRLGSQSFQVGEGRFV
jgi:hypothetical protein